MENTLSNIFVLLFYNFVVVVVVETPFYLQAVYIYIQQIGVRIWCYGLGRGTH
jgi:hypothetical protein